MRFTPLIGEVSASGLGRQYLNMAGEILPAKFRFPRSAGETAAEWAASQASQWNSSKVSAVTYTPSIPPAAAATDDHVLATWLAEEAGRRLLEVREQGLAGRELKDAGDAAAHELLMTLLAEHRPGDAVLSEEGPESRADKVDRLQAERVWIVDPLDGTREFSEPPRDDWAVHVALWERGADDLTAGAVAQPTLGETFNTGRPPVVPPSTSARPRIAVSRSRPPEFVHGLAKALDAELVPMGSAGVKVLSVARDLTDAYVHAGGQYEWDSAAPVAVARAAGLFTSRIDGTPLRYNQDDVYLPDLIVCRPELAELIVAWIKENGVG